MLIDVFPRKLRHLLRRYASYMLLFIIALTVTSFVILQSDNRGAIDKMSYGHDILDTHRDSTFFKGCVDTHKYISDEKYTKMNATFVMLTRNQEIDDVVGSILSIESHFNQWFNYPYVFLNDQPFDDNFKNKVQAVTSSKVEFGLVGKDVWNFPEKLENNVFYSEAIKDQGDRGIMYGGMESYHKMCRFYSGFFYKHELMRQYEWYWRLEPDVEFYCDISYDPFYEMHQHGKKYGFTIMIPELYWTVPNLFRHTRSFIRKNKIKMGSLWKLFVNNYNLIKTDDSNIANFINYENDIDLKMSEEAAVDYLLNVDKKDPDSIKKLFDRARSKETVMEDTFDKQEYNACHFWSNFEIARLDVFDNDLYNSYFDYLEASGGFWRERWGDAPVHSLGLALSLDVEDVHYFRDIGYRHGTIQHCPKNYESKETKKGQLPYQCANPRFRRSFFQEWYDTSFDEGNSCRCKCPHLSEVEDNTEHCMYHWLEITHSDDDDPTFGKNSGSEFIPKFDAAEEFLKHKDQYQKQKNKS